MHQIRRLVYSYRYWAVLLLSLALLIKALMPAGFMPVMTAKSITVELCSSPGAKSIQIHIPLETPSSGADESDQSCAFAGLGLQGLAGADPLLITQALVFAYTVALLSADLRLPQHESYLRPPLRGPPSFN